MTYLPRNPPLPNKHDEVSWQDILSVLGSILLAGLMGLMIILLLEDDRRKDIAEKVRMDKAIQRAYHEGAASARGGAEVSLCPYGEQLEESWRRGFHDQTLLSMRSKKKILQDIQGY